MSAFIIYAVESDMPDAKRHADASMPTEMIVCPSRAGAIEVARTVRTRRDIDPASDEVKVWRYRFSSATRGEAIAAAVAIIGNHLDADALYGNRLRFAATPGSWRRERLFVK